MKPLLALFPLLISSALAGGAGLAPAAPQYLEVWEGPLTCAAGAAAGAQAMRISVQEWSGTTFKALGEVFRSQKGMGSPIARAELEGMLDGDLSAGRIHLTRWHWLLQPRGLNIANLSAQYNLASDYRHIKLAFDLPQMGCTGAEFQRVK